METRSRDYALSRLNETTLLTTNYRQIPELHPHDIRADVLKAICQAKSGHPGASLSVVEILISVFQKALSTDDGGSRVLLSKGHAAPTLYAILDRLNRLEGIDQSLLRQIGSPLQGHPDRRRVPSVEISTGALGQGLSMGIGFALAARRQSRESWTYVVCGDGEMQEGQVWEAAMYAGAHAVGRFVCVVDCNGYQNEGAVEQVFGNLNLKDSWRSLGWETFEVDGHDLEALDDLLVQLPNDVPSLVLGKTSKGRGISFMEGSNEWHGKQVSSEHLELALKELGDAGT